MSADFYQLLEVDRTAGADEIKRAYRKRARELHPDANPDDPEAEDGIRDFCLSRGLGDVYKRQLQVLTKSNARTASAHASCTQMQTQMTLKPVSYTHLTLPTKRIV